MEQIIPTLRVTRDKTSPGSLKLQNSIKNHIIRTKDILICRPHQLHYINKKWSTAAPYTG